jgi:hypothetical protein
VPGTYAVCRLPAGSPLPEWALNGFFSGVVRTADELSVVCPVDRVPRGVLAEIGWRCLQVLGPLDFALIGVLASLARTLAEAGVSIFVISTYDTDYLLVKETDYARAAQALCKGGYRLVP